MKCCRVLHIDAFSDHPNMGNPAGVVPNGDDYRPEEMLGIAGAVGFNETVFVCASNEADIRLRFFTPGHETDLCGHATIAAIYNHCQHSPARSAELVIETNIGLLPVFYDGEERTVCMGQGPPVFDSFAGDRKLLTEALGIVESDLSETLPIVYGSTGNWTLLVPVRNERILSRMHPRNELFPAILKERPRSSIHPFALADRRGTCGFIARHFSSPFSGTVEDPVTGTASGAMGGYAMRYLSPRQREKRFVVAQGKDVGRDGYVLVHVRMDDSDAYEVRVSGRAAFVGELLVEY